MRRVFYAAVFALCASQASASDLDLDWSSPEAFKASGEALPADQSAILRKAVIASLFEELAGPTGDRKLYIQNVQTKTPEELFGIVRGHLQGKSLEEIEALAR